jgi:D-glycero-D-manno-heptose 1,7-bisphosphate phosphatase
MKGVDIGYLLVRRQALDLLPPGNVSFEAEIYPRLVSAGQLLGNITDHLYYSVGSIERLELTRRFLARRPAVILDRDGVLNKRRPKASYVCDWSEWEWLPGVLDALRHLEEAGWLVVVVTNQAGIARGAMTEEQLTAIHARMIDDARLAGGHISRVYHCPHGWDDGCNCRKPAPGMLFMAQREFALDLSRTTFIGDDERDGQAAAAAGCPFVMVNDAYPLSSAVDALLTQSD